MLTNTVFAKTKVESVLTNSLVFTYLAIFRILLTFSATLTNSAFSVS
ncbi:hypothetical protein BH10BAC2_BH10BAC2_00890 [soil metagenome]